MGNVTAGDIDAYRRIHFPESATRHDAFVAQGGVVIPGDGYVAKLGHGRFHQWFGTKCDGTCPHLNYMRGRDAAPLPYARLHRPSWLIRMIRSLRRGHV